MSIFTLPSHLLQVYVFRNWLKINVNAVSHMVFSQIEMYQFFLK